ncbi:hypothetical protein ACFWY9_10270 [Amycolatopsis sp. NPDC059027]|uniref:hypothetical protein n=1 Tax=Amycolatopsis sp. NPDC059027 TaxID=3346709 RepID=UPI00366A8AE6
MLEALSVFTRMNTDVELLWNWWEEDHYQREHDRVWRILSQWDNGASQREHTEEELEAFEQRLHEDIDKKTKEDRERREALVAELYDKEREGLRLQLLRKEADAGFFRHVLEAPANKAQREDAERRLGESQTEAGRLREQIGDPDDVLDSDGCLPAERREKHLEQHMRYWRHPVLRELATKNRRRFNALLAMPVPDAARMCSECQAPAEWHEYDLSLRLFRSRPARGSTAERLAQLMPGWWERCPACTAYRIGHVWGGTYALPDFTGEQWRAMLPPRLRAIFAPGPVEKKLAKPKPQPLATIPPGPIDEVMAKLQELQAKYPTAQVRQGARGSWELWPATEGPKRKGSRQRADE